MQYGPVVQFKNHVSFSVTDYRHLPPTRDLILPSWCTHAHEVICGKLLRCHCARLINSPSAEVGGAVHAAASGYESVLTPRHPGSTMKRLLYALALERGWTAATLIDDAELSESIGGVQHTFQNYSHRHYGLLRLRNALG